MGGPLSSCSHQDRGTMDRGAVLPGNGTEKLVVGKAVPGG